MKKLVYVYYIDFCSHTTALYVDGVLINEDVRSGDNSLLISLGYTNIPEFRVDYEWIEGLNFVFPYKLEDILFAEEK